MNTNLKFAALVRGAIGASVLFMTPAIVSAANEGDDIVVKSGSPMEKWQKQTTARLDRALQRAYSPRTDTGNSIVQITFTRGPDGKPADPQFYNDEGTWMERSIAKRAVKSLDNLDRVPVAQPGDVRFIANLIFADDKRNLAKLRERLDVMERARLASGDERSQYLALGY